MNRYRVDLEGIEEEANEEENENDYAKEIGDYERRTSQFFVNRRQKISIYRKGKKKYDY